jgi:hypothetical protein
VPHGDVAAAHVMASALGLRSLLGPAGRSRDIAYALIISRAVRPESMLSTAGWWAAGDTTLGADLGVAGATTDEIYALRSSPAARIFVRIPVSKSSFTTSRLLSAFSSRLRTSTRSARSPVSSSYPTT